MVETAAFFEWLAAWPAAVLSYLLRYIFETSLSI